MPVPSSGSLGVSVTDRFLSISHRVTNILLVTFKEISSLSPQANEKCRSPSVRFSISTSVSIAASGALAESERGNQQQVGGNCARGATRLPYHFHRDTKPTSGSPGLYILQRDPTPSWTNFVVWLVFMFILPVSLSPLAGMFNLCREKGFLSLLLYWSKLSLILYWATLYSNQIN